MFIADNITILDQHNNFMHEKSHFKTFAAVFLTLKDKQYVFKVDAADSIDFTTVNLIEKFIKTSVNILSDNDLRMTVSDSVICKLLEFK